MRLAESASVATTVVTAVVFSWMLTDALAPPPFEVMVGSSGSRIRRRRLSWEIFDVAGNHRGTVVYGIVSEAALLDVVAGDRDVRDRRLER